jgi:hypothetical protein
MDVENKNSQNKKADHDSRWSFKKSINKQRGRMKHVPKSIQPKTVPVPHFKHLLINESRNDTSIYESIILYIYNIYFNKDK